MLTSWIKFPHLDSSNQLSRTTLSSGEMIVVSTNCLHCWRRCLYGSTLEDSRSGNSQPKTITPNYANQTLILPMVDILLGDRENFSWLGSQLRSGAKKKSGFIYRNAIGHMCVFVVCWHMNFLDTGWRMELPICAGCFVSLSCGVWMSAPLFDFWESRRELCVRSPISPFSFRVVFLLATLCSPRWRLAI